MHEAGLFFREIARRVSPSDSIIIPACRAWSNEGLERRSKGGGWPRITNQRTERRLRRLASVKPFEITRSVEASYLEDCFGKAGVYANNLSQNPFTWLSIITTNYSASFNPRASSCQARVVTLREHWIDECHQIIFSDEPWFCL
jgi:hypothetical protein